LANRLNSVNAHIKKAPVSGAFCFQGVCVLKIERGFTLTLLILYCRVAVQVPAEVPASATMVPDRALLFTFAPE
jgi:hypothetical protein